jgi:hypothetical protein
LYFIVVALLYFPIILQAKREDEVKRAHDEAMFGGPTTSLAHAELANTIANREESNENIDKDQGGISIDTSSLVSDKVKDCCTKITFLMICSSSVSLKLHWFKEPHLYTDCMNTNN